MSTGENVESGFADSQTMEKRGLTVAVHADDQPVSAANSEAVAPMLSVAVLNYNYAHYLPQCLDSILRQTWTDFELILINDCSTDNSLEVIQPYLADPRLEFINHK